MTTVSVVIPAYNAAAFIEATLDSVRAQTYTDYEIVVVDDGSSDGTHAVVEAWLARHKASGRCIRQPNKMIAGARNTGLRAAAGAFIALLDHDDLWYPDKLERVMRAFAEHPEADLIGHHINMTKDGRVLRTIRKGPAAARMYERLLLTGNALGPSATVFRRDKALAIGGFRENPEFNTVEDYDFWMRLSRVARFFFVDETLAEYPVVERSASSRVEYHHSNLEALLQDHFATHFGPRPGLGDRLRMRRRLAAAHRSAVGALLEANASPAKTLRRAARMLGVWPFDPKNLGRAVQAAAAVVRRAHNYLK